MENYMLKEALTMPKLIVEISDKMYEAADGVISEDDINSIERVYIYGCGDSKDAAVAGEQIFFDIANIPSQAINSLYASRYLSKSLTKQQARKTLAIGISASGEAGRTVEATKLLTNAGVNTVMITANSNSSASKCSKYVVIAKAIDYDRGPIPIPGVRSFIPGLISIYMLAISIALRRNVINEDCKNKLLNEIKELGQITQKTFDNYKNVLEEFAKLVGKYERFELLSAGPGRGGFDFCYSKYIEAYGHICHCQDIEEYAHSTFFANDPNELPTALLIPVLGNYCDRADEIRFILNKQTRPLLIVTDNNKISKNNNNEYVVIFNETIRDCLIGLPVACVMTLLSSLTPFRDGDSWMHGHLGLYNEDDLPTVKNCSIL